jgi:hypothetical protein
MGRGEGEGEGKGKGRGEEGERKGEKEMKEKRQGGEKRRKGGGKEEKEGILKKGSEGKVPVNIAIRNDPSSLNLNGVFTALVGALLHTRVPSHLSPSLSLSCLLVSHVRHNGLMCCSWGTVYVRGVRTL